MKRELVYKEEYDARIAALEQQLAEAQRKAAALDWLEGYLADEDVGSLRLFGDSELGFAMRHTDWEKTLTEAIEALREQVEET